MSISRYVAALLVERADARASAAHKEHRQPVAALSVRRSRLEGADVDWSSLYDLRHFFASHLAKQGANEQQIGRLLCHVGQCAKSRYVHQDIENVRPHEQELPRPTSAP